MNAVDILGVVVLAYLAGACFAVYASSNDEYAKDALGITVIAACVTLLVLIGVKIGGVA
jgi:uncharacterized membrane protein